MRYRIEFFDLGLKHFGIRHSILIEPFDHLIWWAFPSDLTHFGRPANGVHSVQKFDCIGRCHLILDARQIKTAWIFA